MPTLNETTNAFLAHSFTSGLNIFGVGVMFNWKLESDDWILCSAYKKHVGHRLILCHLILSTIYFYLNNSYQPSKMMQVNQTGFTLGKNHKGFKE